MVCSAVIITRFLLLLRVMYLSENSLVLCGNINILIVSVLFIVVIIIIKLMLHGTKFKSIITTVQHSLQVKYAEVAEG